MKPNLSEYIPYYLTDFEWLILFSLLQKPNKNLSFVSQFSLEGTNQQLQSILLLPYLDIHVQRKLAATPKEGIKIDVACNDISALEMWLADYIEHYKSGKIANKGIFTVKYERDLESTLRFLECCKQRNNFKATIRREIEGKEDSIFCANANSRLFEHLFILGQYGAIDFVGIDYTYTQPKQITTKAQIIVSMTISFQRIGENETGLSISPQIAHIQPKDSALAKLPPPYDQFEIKKTNPFDVKTTSIFYEGKKLNFKYNTQGYRLLEFLINACGVVSKQKVINMLRLTVYYGTEKMEYAKDGEEIERIRRKRQYDNLKLYCSRVRNALPRSVTLVLDEDGVYLRKS